MSQIKRSVLLYVIALSIFLLARAGLVILYFPFFKELGISRILFSFVEGLRFDLASVTILISIPVLLLNLPFRICSHKYWSALLSGIVILTLIPVMGLLIGDIVYFDFVKRHISYELLTMRGEDAVTVAEMSLSIFIPYLLAFFVGIIVLGIVSWRFLKMNTSWITSLGYRWFRFIAWLVLLIVVGRGGIGSKPITIIDAFASGDTKYGNLVMNGIFSMMHSSLKSENVNHHFFSEDQAIDILFKGKANLNKQFPVQRTHSPPKTGRKLNLVLVLTESLSFKYVDAFAGNNLKVTAHLDRLARQGLMFTNFYASGQRSVEGLQSTLTGIGSTIGLPTIGIGLLANYSKLGYLAQANGYATIFVQSLKRRSFRTDAIAGSVGFQEFYGMEDMPILLEYPDPDAAKYGWDYETFMFAADRIEKAERPFLAYIVTSTTHTPYPRLPDGLEKYPHFKNKESGFLNTLNYSDWSIGEFIKRLKKHPWFNHTVFLFTADHALAHYQSGGFKERFHIPLIIYAPEVFDHHVISTVSSQLDVFPTLIDIMGLQGRFSTLGTSLLDRNRTPIAYIREGSIMGVIYKNAYLRHSLKNRLETGFIGESESKANFDIMEKKLLAADQLTYELIQANRWME